MNEHLMVDAISCIDEKLIVKHLEQRERLKKHKRKSSLWAKWSAVAAACAVVAILAVPVVNNLRGYNSGLTEKEIYERTHTTYQTYEELKTVIGNETLLENIDFSLLEDYGMTLTHELDDTSRYLWLSYMEKMENDVFDVLIYFPLGQENMDNYCPDDNIVVINGINVEYLDRTAGTNEAYYYMAEFEYNGCVYVVRSYGDTGVDVFWEKLSDLLGE